jgi:predicted permease
MISELWSELRYRLRAVLRRDALERELDEELRWHLEREAEKLRRNGVASDEAVRQARLSFGGVDRIKEDARDARGTMLMEHVAQDVRFALRGIRTRPAFAAVVIGTLALGVGVNAAMFGILDRTLFRAPAYLVDPASVNRLYVTWTGPDGHRGFQRGLEYTRYADFARWSRSISAAAAFAYRDLAIGERENTRELVVGIVSASFFDFFNAKPVLGRFFGPQEDKVPVGDAVAVISFGYWQSQYGGREDALGTTIRIGRDTYRIIGVAPRGFDGMSEQRSPIAFVPITAYAAASRPNYYQTYQWSWLEVIVRRKPGVDVAAATADLSNAYLRSWNAERAIATGVERADVAKPEAVAGPVQLARGPMAGPETKVIVWIAGVALIVLLIATANVANLLLARALRRRREMAVRRAIGGTRGRLIQQILTETLLLAALGTVAGLIGAQLTAGMLRTLLVPTADASPVVTDARTLAFGVVAMVVTALLAGLLPALHVGRGDLAGSLKAGTRDAAYRHSRTRTTLLVFQTALSVVLLVGAGLFVRSLQSVRAMRLGYDVDRLAYVSTNLRGVKLTPVEGKALADNLLATARSIPGVDNASLAVSIPFWSFEGRGLYVPGIDSVRKLGRFTLQAGSPEYFATLGTRIVRGRGLSADDRANAPYVVVVSEAMAKALWPNQEPIRKCIRISSDTLPCTTVVGVAENIKVRQIAGDPEFMYYLPFEQYLAELGPPGLLSLFVRVHGRADDHAETLRASLQRVMPGAAYVKVMPMHELVDPTMRSWTSGASMFLAFGALALALAAIGLYAVIAFAVVQRTQELGVRIALGASAGDVLRLIVGEGVRVTLAGVVIGGAIAFLAGRGMSGLLFHVSPRDPMVYGVVALTLIAVGILASGIPASRAARVDPNVALRVD